jgi:hypothetical protein
MAHTAKGDIIVLGLSAENVRRLVSPRGDGKPQ